MHTILAIISQCVWGKQHVLDSFHSSVNLFNRKDALRSVWVRLLPKRVLVCDHTHFIQDLIDLFQVLRMYMNAALTVEKKLIRNNNNYCFSSQDLYVKVKINNNIITSSN